MIASDGEDSGDGLDGNVELNETAHSIHQQCLDQDQDMLALDPCLKRFIKEELIVSFKLDDLEHEYIFKNKTISTLNPIPPLYFLPHQILVFDRVLKLENIRDDIENLKKDYYSISLFRKSEELFIKAHSRAELVFYTIRLLKNDEKLHSRKQLLDQKHLIDKLYQYYSRYYEKVYFQETAILILYWAHQKEILDEDLNEHVLKLIIICIFINFGYGVPNVVEQHLNNKDILKENNKMYAYSRINQRGETEIEEDLMRNHTNYTIQEKRGFYMTSKRKFMQIKDIIPICFPLVPLKADKHQIEKAEVEKNIKPVLQNDKEKMSICKNIFKIFKFLHNKFDKRMKLVVDFEEKLAYRQEFSESFEMEILHPVLNNSLCRIEGHAIRRLKIEINNIYEGFNKLNDPITVIKEMFCKKRLQL